MIPIKRLHDLSNTEQNNLFNRFGEDFISIMIDTVIPIVNEVRNDGDRAVIKYTEKFDKVKLDSLVASEEEIESGNRNVPEKIHSAFLEAKKNIEEFHEYQKRDDISYSRENGTTLGVMYQPIERAAIYIPGGKALYPSSILMGVIPAKIAGTKAITLITPPDQNGTLPDIICSICKMLGIQKIVKSGGAQGIAAAGLGTESVSKSNIVVGPGNIYVTAAKTYLFSLGLIQIDTMAGPSETLIIADKNANPKWVAWDLLSQAEHDEMAQALLITNSQELAEKVRDEIIDDIESGCGRHRIKKTSLQNNGLILLVNTINEAIEFSNQYGSEHLQLMVNKPLDYLDRIKNVGSLFLGSFAPVAVGDYFSGTNHILPTGGAARFSSGVSVDTFMRRTTFQMLTRDALKIARDPIKIMSQVEGFKDKHGGSIDVRFEKD